MMTVPELLGDWQSLKLMKGRDGLVHAAKIRTAQGRTNRPIAKLIPLKVSSDVTSNASTEVVSDSGTANVQTSPIDESSTTQTSEGGTVERTSRPQHQATQRGRDKVKNWVKELGGPPEEVTD